MEQEQTIAVKKALCVDNNVANLPMSHWPTRLVDRAICDNLDTVNTSILQLIPYVTIFRQGNVSEGESAGSVFVLAYDRASGSGETRLIGKSSIGFGGHVDKEVETSIANTFAEEAMRELKEELNYTVDKKLMYRSTLEAIISKRLVYLNDTPVDSVHLGLSIMLNYDEEPNRDDFIGASSEVANLRWISMDDVTAEELLAFEGWSSFLLQRFQHERAEEKKQQELMAERMKAAMDQIQAQQDQAAASSPAAEGTEGQAAPAVVI